MKKPAKVAAIQLAVQIGDSTANIASCERLALQAVNEGAKWIALPEFFTTGVSWNPRIVDAIQNMEGSAAKFMSHFSTKHQVVLGGSFLCLSARWQGAQSLFVFCRRHAYRSP